jgi:hypothetical protein
MLIIREDHTEDLQLLKDEINRRFTSIFAHIAPRGLNTPTTLESFKTARNKVIIKENSIFASRTFQRLGFIDPKRFGPVCTKHFWYFIYTADAENYLILQKRYLLELQKILKDQSAFRPLYALLYDKLAIKSGKKQRYGTQKVDDYEESIIDFKNLKSRQEAMGLVP